MGLWTAQTSFTKGELDPLLVGRTDLEAYYQGVEEATNVECLPQGGLRKRNGFRYIDTVSTVGDDALNVDYGIRLEAFKFSETEQYLLVFVPHDFAAFRVYFYKDAQLITGINGGGDDYLAIPADGLFDRKFFIRDFDYIQSANTIIIVHEENAPLRIVRGATDSDWTFSDVPLSNIPQFDFNDASSPTPVDEVQDIQLNNGSNGDIYKLSLNGVLTDEIPSSLTDGPANANNIQKALQELPNTGTTGVSVVANTATTFTVTFSGSSANDWDTMIASIVSSVNTNFNVAITPVSDGTARTEDVWSATRGWPRTATFHENRLWFGGSKSRPSTVWGSTTLDPFDFDSGRARDDEGVDATLATDQINTINGIISNRALQIFTSGAEFYVPESPITPSNFSVVPQTNLGTKRVRPVVLEGSTHFIQRTGKAIFEFQFINEFQANEARSVSILAPHLINDPSDLSVKRGSLTNDANYMYIGGVNLADPDISQNTVVPDTGSLAVFNSNKLEGVQALTRFTSQRYFRASAVVDDLLYVAVSDVLNNTIFDNAFICIEDPTLNTDYGKKADTGGSGILTGLDQLEGETVKVIADGAVQEDQVVTGGQVVVTGQDLNGDVQVQAASVVEAGLEYQPKIRAMPFNVNLNDGPHVAQKKRIMRVGCQFDNSIGVIINGERLPVRTIGVNQFDPPQPQTGLDRVFLHGWSLTAQVEITQDTPYDMTILALNVEVKV
jgi:hypothetical protein